MANKVHCKNKAKIQTGVQLWSKNDDVATPDDLYDALNKEFKFDHDPCPFGGKQKGKDGLSEDWGKSNYVNPPYSQIKLWFKKAIKEMKKVNKSVFLVPLRLGTKYFVCSSCQDRRNEMAATGCWRDAAISCHSGWCNILFHY